MNPQDNNKNLQKKADIENADSMLTGMDKNEDALNDSYSQFVNSITLPEAIIRASQDVPEGIIKSLVWKYVKTINSILSKTLFYLGIELGSSNEDITNKAKEATKKVALLTLILIKVLDDPEVKENVRQLAIELNNAVLRPFLEASLVTVGELSPQIDEASDKLAGRIHNGVRKLTDSVGNGVLAGLGTVPYIGNILNATGTIANTLLGVQSVIDESVGAVLDQTLQTLIILQKVGGPGVAALDSWINFALNANNAFTKFKNQYDRISATMNGQKFIPDPMKSKDDLMNNLESTKISNESSVATEAKPSETNTDAPIATDVKPVKGKASGPAKAKAKVGGGRKKRKNKTKKRNHKKRTKSRRRRSK